MLSAGDETVDSTNLAPPPGSDFYYATLYVSDGIRASLSVLEAFRAEISRIPVNSSDPGVARVKLGWWRDEIGGLGKTPPQHPISQALAVLMQHKPSLKRTLEQTIDAVDASFIDHRALTSAERLAQVDAVHGDLWVEYARVCGADDERTCAAVRALGSRIEIGYDLRDLRKLIDAGIVPISLEHLREHGLDADHLTAPSTRSALHRVIKQEIEIARDQIANAISAIPGGDRRAQRVAVTLARIVAANLTEVARDGYAVMERRIELTPVRKLWVAWRTRFSR